jgi:hypothetical protein
LGVDNLLIVAWTPLLILTVAVHFPHLAIVCKDQFEIKRKLPSYRWVMHWCGGLNAIAEVPRHPVGTLNVILGFASGIVFTGVCPRTVLEIEDARVFEEPADKRVHRDIFADPLNTGP